MTAFVEKQHSSRVGAVQALTASTTHTSTALGSETFQIRLSANTNCHYAIDGSGVTASTSDNYLPAHVVEYVTVTPGQFIATLQAATGGLDTGTAGTLWVTELS